jgi:hypothetical protein
MKAVTFQLTAADLKAGIAEHQPSRGASRVLGWGAALSLVLLGGALHFLGTVSPVPPDFKKWEAVSLALGVTLCALIAAQEVMIDRMLRKRAAGHEATTLTVSDDGLEFLTRGAASRIAWSRLLRYRESADYFLLYHAAEQYFLIPKRDMEGESEWQEMRALLRAHITLPK